MSIWFYIFAGAAILVAFGFLWLIGWMEREFPAPMDGPPLPRRDDDLRVKP
jgi:hypothetical protein